MRRALTISLIAVLAFVGIGGAAVVGTGAWLWSRAPLDTTGQVAFDNPLAVPPLAESRIDQAGRRVFDLTAQPGEHDLGGGPMETWGFNGDYLGPTLRAHRGEEVVINFNNQLPEPTTVHWHGMHLPAKMDGGPHQQVEPGGSWSPTWRIDQPAASLWYHPHPHNETETHVYRGLAGMFLLDDDESSGLPLPREYGVDDFPVVVQDKRFRNNRLEMSRSLFNDSGVLGDSIVVNGTPSPYLDVTTEQVRLRLLNGSTARSYDFGFADGRRFAQIGSDGGLLAEPHHTDRVMLSPGERAEIVVAMQPGEEAVLRSSPPDLGVDPFSNRFIGGGDTLDILQLRAADELAPRPELPGKLVDLPRIDPNEAVEVRSIQLAGRQINGERMAMDRIDAVVEAGSTEIWLVENIDGTPHNFHIHDVQFQVVSVDGNPPPPPLQGWKDTIFLPSGVEFELIAQFSRYADPDVPYMFHCHLLYHEDGGMMGQFVVVEPGQQPGTPPAHNHHEG